MRKIKIDKRGFLLADKTLGIIIALACLVVLVLLGGKLYSMFIEKGELDKAKATLELVKGKIDAVELDETLNFKIVNPKGWYLVSYPINTEPVSSEKARPNNCEENCVCICPIEIEEKDIKDNGDSSLTTYLYDQGISPNILREYKDYYNYNQNEIDKFYIRFYFVYYGLQLCQNQGICEDIDMPLIIQKNDVEKQYIAFYELPKDLRITKEADKYIMVEE